jgi:hypothetical protein
MEGEKNIPSISDCRLKAHYDLFEKKYGKSDLADKTGKFIF